MDRLHGSGTLSHRMNTNAVRAGFALAAVLALVRAPIDAQDRLRSMPGYERYQRISGQVPGSVKLGALMVHWKDDGSSFEYEWNGKKYRYDIASLQAVVVGEAPEGFRERARGGSGGRQPARGRQLDSTESPDGQLMAFYKDRNVWVSAADGAAPAAVTTDGGEAQRVKYGTASWVYGEELAQRSAMWWSPDSRKLAYYRFDEKLVPDFYLPMNQTQVQDTLDVEAYPKPGKPNPVVDVFVYDLPTKRHVRLDVRDGRPFDNTAVGHYVYNVAWSPDGREILLNRTNRKQNVLELAACNPDTGACRAVVHEEWPTGWIENRPEMRFLKDGRRFIWESQRSGWKNFYLYDLNGRLIAPLTNQTADEAESIVLVDEPHNALFYTARDGDNYLKLQLHRVGLDGRNDTRLTDPAFMHIVTPSPDGRYFIDVEQTHDTPPVTRLIDRDGHRVAELARSDTTAFDRLGLKKVEMFTYMAADGKTELHGLLHFPSTFDPSKRYPVLASVYGGPTAAAVSERFTLPSPLTEYGFLVLTLDSRAAPGMGKRTLDEIYLKLGQVEMDDMALGVKALWSRPYFDRTRVGIHGSSYGGYTSAMELLRHPEVFAAASAASPPTDWRNYDTIYTERYMWIPDENKTGYDAGSAMTYAGSLKGRLLIYYGTSDNNVHPSNSLQLIKALQQAGKSFEVQVGPDQGHSNVNPQRMMEFFIDALVLHPQASTPVATPVGSR
jgi:dipeptidyl-peptidase-4